MAENEYCVPQHARAYLAGAAQIPHRTEGEAVLLEFVPLGARRTLDLGTGAGRLLSLLLAARPHAEGVATDFSPTLLDAARARFAASSRVQVIAHDLDDPLPALGSFDVVVSSFAIHHCADNRKRAIYREVHDLLEPGGFFANLEHVASPTPALHEEFYRRMGKSTADEDPSNKLAPVTLQLAWLRTCGFVDVDCYWKWMELALIGGWTRRASAS
jgi:SAM-dependent methyltransferase